MSGRIENFIGGALFQQLAVGHEQHPVAHFTGEAHFVGDHHHGHTAPGQFLHDFQNFAYHFGVQSGGGLVEEHDLGLHHQGPDDGHALLLTAGELDGVGVCPVTQAHAVQQGQGLLLGFLLVHAQHLHGSQGHVFNDGLVGKEVEVLEDHAHLLAVEVDIHLFGLAFLVDELLLGDVDAVEDDLAPGGDLQQVQAAKQGGLAGAGGADDHHHVALVDIHGDIIQGVEGAFIIVFLQVLDLDQLIVCRHGSFSFRSIQ